MSSAHHPVPIPHPTGFLNFADALERSCNVYFETMANRMGIDLLSVWYDRWGLGRRTGLGIPEAVGRLPRDFDGPVAERLRMGNALGGTVCGVRGDWEGLPTRDELAERPDTEDVVR